MTLNSIVPAVGRTAGGRSAEHRWSLALALVRLPDERAADAAQRLATLRELHVRIRDAVVAPARAPATPFDGIVSFDFFDKLRVLWSGEARRQNSAEDQRNNDEEDRRFAVMHLHMQSPYWVNATVDSMRGARG